MSMLLLLLTNILVPFIILSSFNENKGYSNNFYALILLMQFGLVGVFTVRWFIILRFLGSNSYPNLVYCWTLGDR
jgi:NADH:ubiquinone oxidoreductase subunit 4 (subunit M)